MRGRVEIPHSHLPAGIISHHAPSGRGNGRLSCLMHLVFGCSVKASGSLPHFEHTPWPLIRCRSFGAMFEFLGSLFDCSLQLLSRNLGFTAGRGFNPAGGAPGGDFTCWAFGSLVFIECRIVVDLDYPLQKCQDEAEEEEAIQKRDNESEGLNPVLNSMANY
ncbi:hypothetical protein F511_37653 [Dorcoceras hygrometricum]|uniref:Uncharacterized protein n=1 Tax=Dorcoceras hygrometricum TaxID=472368 RepID=A0A2Z7C0V5_9LAMI|nr:hypothetical protein F511_37653 [Dorcoceras hygrometricum]